MRELCRQALAMLDRHPIREWLPLSLLQGYQLPEINDALRTLHAPPVSADTTALLEYRHPARHRLVMEELLAHHLSLLKIRAQVQSWQALPLLPGQASLEQQFRDSLAFKLTGAQERVSREIRQDLTQPLPMLRLVQGDVGSGKTVVAALAALQAIEAGTQVALMAPTEILAEQHYLTFQQWLAPLGLTPGWLSGKTRSRQRQEVLAGLASGEVPMVIGTHALFQEDVVFQRLALVIIDEQHRFGVHQRLALKEKGRPKGRFPIS